jgi:choline dehydrogenase-like flavoprotein
MQRGVDRDTAHRVTVRPKVVALCGGAINSPMVLLRSGINANDRVGRRTFLHPVVALAGIYDEVIAPYFGAPQSIGSHQFIDRGADSYGVFLEASPMHPMLTASASGEFGPDLGELMSQLAHVSGLLSLHVDGLLPGDEGGTVSVRSDGRPNIDYPVSERLASAMSFSHELLAKIHFAAGARQVATLHTKPVVMRSADDVRLLAGAAYGGGQHAIFSAHQMGGCAMGPKPETSVVDTNLRHHDVPNLFVVDGSVLPTALGVNPSQTIYGLAHRARGDVAGAV